MANMQLLRCFAAAAASLALLVAPLPRLIRWALALWLAREANSVLTAWAENRWQFKDDKSMWHWERELAVVTGGSGGIGALVVKKLVSHGLTVAVLDVEPLSDVFHKGRWSRLSSAPAWLGLTCLAEERRRISFYQCDISSQRAVHKAAEAIRSDHGSPSVLINNAGIGSANTILEISPERLQSCFGINLLSHWYTTQEFLPDMIAKRKGHVMSTSSMSAWVAFAGAAEYASTKAALTVFHEVLTQELKHRYKCPQIKTSIVYPTWTRTRLITSIEKGIRDARGPIMDPGDVAASMVDQIIAARSGQLILGPNLATLVRAFPVWIQEFIRDRMAQVVTGRGTTAVASESLAEARQPGGTT